MARGQVLIRQCGFGVALIAPSADPAGDRFLENTQASGLARCKFFRDFRAGGHRCYFGGTKTEQRAGINGNNRLFDLARRVHWRDRRRIDTIERDFHNRAKIPVVVKNGQQTPVICLCCGDDLLGGWRCILGGLFDQQRTTCKGLVEVRLFGNARDLKFSSLGNATNLHENANKKRPCRPSHIGPFHYCYLHHLKSPKSHLVPHIAAGPYLSHRRPFAFAVP